MAYAAAAKLCVGMTALAGCLCLPPRVLAQDTPSRPAESARRWEIEFHAGQSWLGTPREGTGALPSPGSFTRFGRVDPREPSWYFGDGTALLNGVMAASGLSPRVTPLDSVLQSVIADRSGGGSVGVRLGRQIAARLDTEFGVDYVFGTLDVTPRARAGIEVSRSSFASTWATFLNDPLITGVRIGSVATVSEPKRADELLASGVVNVALLNRSRTRGYVTLGGAYLSNRVATVGATLKGQYQFILPTDSRVSLPPPFDETDLVSIRHDEREGLVAVVGGGLKYFASNRTGIRLDVRAFLSPSRSGTLVDATPSVVTVGPTEAGRAGTDMNAIRFVNNETYLGEPTTLSGRAVNFPTFSSTGVQQRIAVTVGLFWRF